MMALSVLRLFSFGLEVNKSKESSDEACIKLFNQAEHTIVILSGELNEEFYGDSQVCRDLTNAVKRGVRVKVGYGPQASNKIVKVLQKLRKKYGNVELYPLSERPEPHFMIIDEKTVRRQLGHARGTQEHRAVIKYNSPELALKYLNFFKSVVGEREG
jgi:sugar-specific transcriptional regulator TrmB